MRVIANVLAWLVAIGLLIPAGLHAERAEPKRFVSGSWAEMRAGHGSGPLIVHFWGLTCAPCRTEMPEWGQLHAALPEAPMVFVHAERAPPGSETMTTFLAQSGLAAADNWFFAERFMDRLRFEIDPGWHGEMPATMLVARDGTARLIVGSADMAEVRRWIEAESKGNAR